MRRFLFVLLAGLLTIPVFSSKKTDKEMILWEYEVQDLGQVSKDGKSVIFKIWTYSKKPSITMTQASKNAVHAVIFKQIGYNPALATTPDLEFSHKDFFDEFFKDGGAYRLYVQFANNGAIAPGDNIKMEKGYKIGIKVFVNRADLRKYLEDKGVIKSMNSMF